MANAIVLKTIVLTDLQVRILHPPPVGTLQARMLCLAALCAARIGRGTK